MTAMISDRNIIDQPLHITLTCVPSLMRHSLDGSTGAPLLGTADQELQTEILDGAVTKDEVTVHVKSAVWRTFFQVPVRWTNTTRRDFFQYCQRFAFVVRLSRPCVHQRIEV